VYELEQFAKLLRNLPLTIVCSPIRPLQEYPYFTRTIPADSAVSLAAVEFLANQGFDRVGCVYVNDPYGIAFKDGVVAAAGILGISVRGG